MYCRLGRAWEISCDRGFVSFGDGMASFKRNA